MILLSIQEISAFFPFDASEKSWNMNINDNILEKLKNRVDMYADGDSSDIKLCYFIFLQNLKKVKEPFITIHECEDIAQNSYIALENQEMYEALHLFHEVNLILYFGESEKVKDLVFLDPNTFSKW